MEGLFLVPSQGDVFLALLSCGVLLGALMQLLSALRRRVRPLAAVWDAVFALCLGATVLAALLRWRESQLRLYALLGVLVGILLYVAGPGRIIAWLARKIAARRALQARKSEEAQRQKETPPTAAPS